MKDDNWHRRTLEALKAVVRAAGDGTDATSADVAALVSALSEDLDPEAQFALGQRLVGQAFAMVSHSGQIENAATIGEIDSVVAQEEHLSPKGSRPTHVPVPDEAAPSDEHADDQYVRRVRELVPGVEEREGELGGYVSLADLNLRRCQQTGQRAVHNPAALGLAHTEDESSMYELVRKRRLRLDRVEGHGYNASDSLRIRLFNPGGRVLVRIERGTVFERSLSDAIQNLSVKDDVALWLNPGVHELRAFGLCMDQSAAPPNGEAMLLTPWVLKRRVDGQDDLWQFTDRPSPDEADRSASESAPYRYEAFGKGYSAESQKEVLTGVFRVLAEQDVEFLENMVVLYQQERPDVIPIVARRRRDLPAWARDSSVQIAEGYWLHTALPGKVKTQKLAEACEVAGVTFGDATGVRVEF